MNKFISRGGTLAESFDTNGDHRLTLRIPKQLMDKVEVKRKQQVGIWILELQNIQETNKEKYEVF